MATITIAARACAAFLFYVCACVTASSEGARLRYAQAFSAMRTVFALPLFVAERQGFFAQEGLDFSVVPIAGGGEKLIEALHQDRADVAHVATPFLIQAALAGSDAVAIAAEFNNPVYSLVARPEIRTYADLKGKLIGVAAENGSITLSIRKLLNMHGIGREDFRARFIDGTPGRLVCLTAGDCDAVPLGQPHDFLALRRGYQLIGLSTDAVPEYVYTVTAARRSWAVDNKDKLVRYARALARAFEYIRDPSNRSDVVRTIVETTGFAEENARMTVTLFFEPERGVLPRAGEIDLKGIEQVIALMGDGGVLKPPLPAADRFVDLQFLAAAGVW
jgi:ABC-type nitrate/sulfonate/bicarbonate transport system substrate-binding protein